MVLLKLDQPKKNKKDIGFGGFTLLETLISITIFGVFLMFFLASFSQIFASQDTSWRRVEASLQAQEGLEISYNVFTNTSDWTQLRQQLQGSEVFHVRTEGVPEFVAGQEESEELTREIRIEDVYRSSLTGEIELDHSDQTIIYDPDTVLIKSRVEWKGKNGAEHIEYVTYITRNETQ